MRSTLQKNILSKNFVFYVSMQTDIRLKCCRNFLRPNHSYPTDQNIHICIPVLLHVFVPTDVKEIELIVQAEETEVKETKDEDGEKIKTQKITTKTVTIHGGNDCYQVISEYSVMNSLQIESSQGNNIT